MVGLSLLFQLSSDLLPFLRFHYTCIHAAKACTEDVELNLSPAAFPVNETKHSRCHKEEI